MNPFLITWGIVSVVSAVLGAGICNQKNASGWGVFLGLLFGPLGLLIAQTIDNRPQCPQCSGKWNTRQPAVCPHCSKERYDVKTKKVKEKISAPKGGSLQCCECKTRITAQSSEVYSSITCPACGKDAVLEPVSVG